MSDTSIQFSSSDTSVKWSKINTTVYWDGNLTDTETDSVTRRNVKLGISIGKTTIEFSKENVAYKNREWANEGAFVLSGHTFNSKSEIVSLTQTFTNGQVKVMPAVGYGKVDTAAVISPESYPMMSKGEKTGFLYLGLGCSVGLGKWDVAAGISGFSTSHNDSRFSGSPNETGTFRATLTDRKFEFSVGGKVSESLSLSLRYESEKISNDEKEPNYWAQLNTPNGSIDTINLGAKYSKDGVSAGLGIGLPTSGSGHQIEFSVGKEF